jgi:DNA-binding CsgD family transcriptional regulator
MNRQAVFQFVKSKNIVRHYPGSKIAGTDKLSNILKFAERLNPDKLIIVCGRSGSPSIHYVSANCFEVIGHDAKSIAEMPLIDFLSLVHPDDRDNLVRCFDHINAMEPYDPLHYRFELNYRLRSRDGNYRYVRNEKVAVQDDDGSYVYLALFSNIVDPKQFFEVKLHIQKLINGSYRRFADYNPRGTASKFTPRQRDIMSLIIQGLSNQEIADRLNVSVNTIKNHKGILFKKVNAKSSIELAARIFESTN